ncbi:hypothetical protein LTR28_004576 [Elasticomyces elasticus]|nr:hypothetical protein LTR28_004576 [Elasticomyces elasticus]
MAALQREENLSYLKAQISSEDAELREIIRDMRPPAARETRAAAKTETARAARETRGRKHPALMPFAAQHEPWDHAGVGKSRFLKSWDRAAAAAAAGGKRNGWVTGANGNGNGHASANVGAAGAGAGGFDPSLLRRMPTGTAAGRI